MLDIIHAMRCVLSLAIGLGIGYASAKIARIIGYLLGVSLLVATVADALVVCPVYPLPLGIGWATTEQKNAAYLGLAAAGIFIGMALA